MSSSSKSPTPAIGTPSVMIGLAAFELVHMPYDICLAPRKMDLVDLVCRRLGFPGWPTLASTGLFRLQVIRILLALGRRLLPQIVQDLSCLPAPASPDVQGLREAGPLGHPLDRAAGDPQQLAEAGIGKSSWSEIVWDMVFS